MPRCQGLACDVLSVCNIAACLLLTTTLLLGSQQWQHVRVKAPSIVAPAVATEKGQEVPQTPPPPPEVPHQVPQQVTQEVPQSPLPPPPDLRFARGSAGGRLYCGDWQREYAELHASMLRGEREPRYAVAHGISGLADNLVGAVTMFYVAVLSGRAFFLDMIEGRQYDWAFDKPNIDWTWDGSRAIPNSTWEIMLYCIPSMKDNPEPNHIRHGDIRTFGQEHAVISARTFLGLTVELFENKFHKAKLFRMGLRPDTAFACAMDFLFELKEDIKAEHADTIARLQDPATLKIGIQVRTGDSVLFDHEGGRIKNFDIYASFFDCAAQVEATRRTSDDQPVVWYLVSDSLALRQAAVEKYGPKILTETNITVGHVTQDQNETNPVGVMRTAAAEVWLNSMADINIVSEHSGFGRIAAFWSGQWHHVYSVVQDHRNPEKPPAVPRKCGVRDYDSLEFLAIDNVGDNGPGV